MSTRARVEWLEGRVLLAAGDRDLTFGGGDGVAEAPYPGGGRAVAFTDDGSIIVAGHGPYRDGGFADFALVRYRPDGTLDPTFGPGGDDGDGVVTTPGSGTGGPGASLVVIAPDGKIVAAGGGVTVVRYFPDGTLDTGFGEGGIVRTPAGHGQGVLGIQFEDDGKMLVGVTEAGPYTPAFGIVFRYNDDGTLDPTWPYTTEYLPGTGDDYDDHGLGEIDPFNVWIPDEFAPTAAKVSHAKDSPSVAARQDDGKIVALAGAYTLDARRDGHTAVMRFNADGSLDPTFAHQVHWSDTFGYKWLALQPGTGRVLFGGAEREGFRVVAVQSAPPLDAPRPVPDAPPEATRTLQFSPDEDITTSVRDVTFSIRYEDDEGIDVSTLDGSDVRVELPKVRYEDPARTVLAEFVGVDDASDGPVRVATYRYVHPDGPLVQTDGGAYGLVIEPAQVLDTAGQAVAAGNLQGWGWFRVRIEADAESDFPTATVVSATNVTSAATAAVEIVVRYEDDDGILASTIGDNDVFVRAPDGSSAPARAVGGPFAGTESPRTVTYSYVPPAGGFTSAANGVYTVSIVPTGVFDTTGVGPRFPVTPGTFTVDIPSDAPNLTAGPVTARLGREGVVAGGVRPRGRVWFDVTNAGSRAARGRVAVSVVASADEVFDAADVEVAAGTRRLDLRAARSRRLSLRPGNIPPGMPAGDYRLLARVDVGGAVAEASELDNVGPPSDARLRVVAAPPRSSAVAARPQSSAVSALLASRRGDAGPLEQAQAQQAWPRPPLQRAWR